MHNFRAECEKREANVDRKKNGNAKRATCQDLGGGIFPKEVEFYKRSVGREFSSMMYESTINRKYYAIINRTNIICTIKKTH
jgi:hypothetical protein